jgi:hypothetical protein
MGLRWLLVAVATLVWVVVIPIVDFVREAWERLVRYFSQRR